MSKIVKIECPSCGKTLVVRYMEGLESKSILCPKCQAKSKVQDCHCVMEEKNDETEISSSWYRPTECVGDLIYCHGDEIEIYHLKKGINVIGRKSKQGGATIQVEDEENVISREHLRIEVIRTTEEVVEHRVSLAKANVNETFLNGEMLHEQDIIVLNFEDVIKCKNKQFKISKPQES